MLLNKKTFGLISDRYPTSVLDQDSPESGLSSYFTRMVSWDCVSSVHSFILEWKMSPSLRRDREGGARSDTAADSPQKKRLRRNFGGLWRPVESPPQPSRVHCCPSAARSESEPFLVLKVSPPLAPRGGFILSPIPIQHSALVRCDALQLARLRVLPRTCNGTPRAPC